MPRGSSRTAEAVCAFRAIESLRSDRRLNDPYAASFLPRWSRLGVARIPASLVRAFAVSSLGVFDDVIERHCQFDASIIEAARGPHLAHTLLILGAGYDTRAWRLRDLELDTVEVDFPATLNRKLKCIGRSPATFPTVQLRRAPVDFRTSSWAEDVPRLRGPVVAVWEGVSMYLPEHQVQHSLRTMRDLVGPTGRLLMDVWTGSGILPVRLGGPLLTAIGEPLQFRLESSRIDSFFRDLGFEVRRLAADPGGRRDGRAQGQLTALELRCSR